MRTLSWRQPTTRNRGGLAFDAAPKRGCRPTPSLIPVATLDAAGAVMTAYTRPDNLTATLRSANEWAMDFNFDDIPTRREPESTFYAMVHDP